MIIECPACATRYEVPDTAIGSEGRKVRCAKCRHSWQARGMEADELQPEADEPGEHETAAAFDETLPGPAPDMEGLAAAATVHPPEPAPPFEPANRPLPGGGRRLWAWIAIILAIMIAAAVLAVTFWGLPEWVPGRSPTFAAAPSELVLDFPRDQQGRRQLPNGTEIFGASGTITNQGDTTRRLPPILIVLRDARERIVYSWEVVPPKRSLAPGESVAVNEAVTDAPRSAHFADIGWKPG